MKHEDLKDIIREVLRARMATGGEDRPVAGPAAGPALDLVTEADVMAAREGARVLFVAPGAVVTPLARETAARYAVDLRLQGAQPAPLAPAAVPLPAPADAAGPEARTVALAADHAGYALKETLRGFLQDEAGYRVVDFGTDGTGSVDYPDFAHRVAGAVSRGEAWRGIIVDGVGVGSAMAANRHAGVRAAALNGIVEVLNAREHNDANVLCLGGRMIGDLLARALTVTFLTTAFGGGRHARRVGKIEKD